MPCQRTERQASERRLAWRCCPPASVGRPAWIGWIRAYAGHPQRQARLIFFISPWDGTAAIALARDVHSRFVHPTPRLSATVPFSFLFFSFLFWSPSVLLVLLPSGSDSPSLVPLCSASRLEDMRLDACHRHQRQGSCINTAFLFALRMPLRPWKITVRGHRGGKRIEQRKIRSFPPHQRIAALRALTGRHERGPATIRRGQESTATPPPETNAPQARVPGSKLHAVRVVVPRQ